VKVAFIHVEKRLFSVEFPRARTRALKSLKINVTNVTLQNYLIIRWLRVTLRWH